MFGVLRMVGGWSFLRLFLSPPSVILILLLLLLLLLPVSCVVVLLLLTPTFCLVSFDEMSEVQYAARTNGTAAANLDRPVDQNK